MTTDSTAPVPASPSPRRTRLGIRSKIMLGLTCFNIAVTAAFTLHQYQTEKNRIFSGIESKLKSAATALPRMLPVGYLDTATHAEAVSPKQYLNILHDLSAYCSENNLLYLYTYLQKDGVFYCTSSNATEEEIEAGEYTPYFDPYVDAPPSIFDAWERREPVSKIVTDRWGTVLTLFLPLETRNGTAFIAGADVSIDFVNTLLQGSLRRSLFVGLIAFIAILFLSHYASNHFSHAIKRLAAYTGEFTSSNFSAREDSELRREITRIPQRYHDEIGALAGAFLVMEDQLASYLKNLTETTAIKERIENEIKLAGQIQADMLPIAFEAPAHAQHIDLHATMRPAREAGGDLYDYFFIDDDHLCFAVGDVSGKGVAAALFMTVGITILRANATVQNMDRPDIILSKANNLLCRNNESGNFLTLFLGILNVRSGLLTFSDGGHNRPYLRSTGQSAHNIDVEGGTALGVFEDLPYACQTLQLQAGDCFFLYTDGVNEAVAADQSFYGDDRLQQQLTNIPPDASAEQWVSRLMADVSQFARGAEQSDDITLLALRYLAS